ncbi:MAG: NAD(P) transhydrogenase subunit alpha, partial [Gammaproteobacteria bacterium]|nr:NAD(P) transhydrogenase subunit alpha [Gammaproteobacteria bacterium]
MPEALDPSLVALYVFVLACFIG